MIKLAKSILVVSALAWSTLTAPSAAFAHHEAISGLIRH